jgi:RNA polymerase sigma-70 factor, ECF subfamily
MTDANVNEIEAPSTTLLERVKARDQAAWVRFVDLYGDLVYRWCLQGGLQSADAADVWQEVFRAVARKIGDFRGDRPGDCFLGWLRTIARNKRNDFFQRHRPGNVGEGGSSALERLRGIAEKPDAESDPARLREETRLLYSRAVALIHSEFEEPSWRAFWRVAVEEQSPEDVARELNMTLNAVYLAKSRVLRRLRQEFAVLIDI